jgi:hypothetical protein
MPWGTPRSANLTKKPAKQKGKHSLLADFACQRATAGL